jgi:hypothetical protein
MTAKIKLNAASGGGSFSLQAPSSSANDRVMTLPDSADGTILTTTNPKAGNIIQVVHTKKTDALTTTSQTYVDLMTATITPSASSNKILIRYGVNGGTNGDVNHVYVTIYRDSTDIGQADAASNRSRASSVINTDDQSTMFFGNEVLDSPSSTSAIVYRIKVRTSNTQTAFFNRSARDTDLVAYDGRSTSFVTLMEVAS